MSEDTVTPSSDTLSTERTLQAVLGSDRDTVVLGAPELGKSTLLDDIAENRDTSVVRTPDVDALPDPGTNGSEVVLDDFYRFFLNYRELDNDTQQRVRERVRGIDDDGPLHLCTTPYRLNWILERYRGEFEDLCGSVDELSAAFLQLDEEDGVDVLLDLCDVQRLTGLVAEARQRINQTEFRFPIDETPVGNLDRHAGDGSAVESGWYRTHVPSICHAAVEYGDIETYFDRRDECVSVFDDEEPGFVRRRLPESVEKQTGWLVSGLGVSGVYDAGTRFANLLGDDVEALLKDGFQTVATGTIALAPLTEPTILSIVGLTGIVGGQLLGDDGDEVNVLSILSEDGFDQSQADLERLERSLGAAPLTIEAIRDHDREVATLRDRIDDLFARVRDLETDAETTSGQVDTLQERVRTNEDDIAHLRERFERVAQWRPPQMTTVEGGVDLYHTLNYVPVRAEYRTETVVRGEDPEMVDPLERLAELVSGDDRDRPVPVVGLYGEGGIGKSRLLLELEREVGRKENAPKVLYVNEPWDGSGPPQLPNPDSDRDVVLCVDDAGRKGLDEYLRLVNPDNRRSITRDRRVQVIISAREAYKDDLNAAINDAVPYEFAIQERERAGTHTQQIPVQMDRQAALTPSLTLRPLPEASEQRAEWTRKLVDQLNRRRQFDYEFSVQEIEEINEEAGGNPFFVQLLVELVADGKNPDLTRALDRFVGQVVDETTDLDAFSNPDAVRVLLEIIAAWQRYEQNDPDQRAALNDVSDVEDEYTRQKTIEALTGPYLRNTIKNESGTDGVYEIRHDVIADYLRFEVVASETGLFRTIARDVVDSIGERLVAGLVVLESSSLRPFYPDADERIHTWVEWTIEAASGRGDQNRLREVTAPLNVAIRESATTGRTQRLDTYLEILSDYADQIPDTYARGLRNAIIHSTDDTETVERLLSRFEANDTPLAGHFDDPDVRSEFVAAVSTVATTRNNLDTVEQLLARLGREETPLANSLDKQKIRRYFASGLLAVIRNTDEADAIEQLLARFEGDNSPLADHLDDPDVRRSFASALGEAVVDIDDLDTIERVLSRLEGDNGLLARYPDDSYIRRRFSIALMNAIIDVRDKDGIEQLLSRFEGEDAPLTEYVDDPENPEIRRDFAGAIRNGAAEIGEPAALEQFLDWFEGDDGLLAAYVDDPEVRSLFAETLFNAVSHNRDIDAIEGFLDRFEEEDAPLAGHLDQPEVRRTFAEALMNAVANVENPDAIKQLLDRFDGDNAPLGEYYDDPEIRLRFANTLFNAVRRGTDFDTIDEYLSWFEGTDAPLSEYLDDPDVRSRYVMSLKFAVLFVNELEVIEEILHRFEGESASLARYTDDPDVRAGYARTVANATFEITDPAAVWRLLGRFENEDARLAAHLADPEVRGEYARALSNAIVDIDDFDTVEQVLGRFEGDDTPLAGSLGDPDIRAEYARVLRNGITVADDIDAIEQLLDRFVGEDALLAGYLDDSDVRVEYARALRNAAVVVDEIGTVDQVLRRFEGEDEPLAEYLDDPDVRIQFGIALLNAIETTTDSSTDCIKYLETLEWLAKEYGPLPRTDRLKGFRGGRSLDSTLEEKDDETRRRLSDAVESLLPSNETL